MKLEGIVVTPTMVRYVWQRKGLSTRLARIQWVKRQSGGCRCRTGREGQTRLQTSLFV